MSQRMAIEYSDKYQDADFEYRHVTVPSHIVDNIPRGRLLSEAEWRGLGIVQSRGWQHYALHRPESHILLFRRPLGTDPVSGEVNEKLRQEAQQMYAKHLEINGRK